VLGGTPVGLVVVVVVDPEAEAVAMTGRNGAAVGAVVVDPDVGRLSLGYAVHDILNALPDKAATTRVDWS
jgi:hypothetical protein